MEVTPYRMTPDVIRSVVQKHRPGVFLEMMMTDDLPSDMWAARIIACRPGC